MRRNIGVIYNKGLRGNKKIFFSDYMRNRGGAVRDYTINRTSPYNDVDISSLT